MSRIRTRCSGANSIGRPMNTACRLMASAGTARRTRMLTVFANGQSGIGAATITCATLLFVTIPTRTPAMTNPLTAAKLDAIEQGAVAYKRGRFFRTEVAWQFQRNSADHALRLVAEVRRLRPLLREAADRLERCATLSGTAPEYAAAAVAKYREALKEAGDA